MAPDDNRLQRMQDFIFARELAEVYLLLDHVSERSDKNLSKAFSDAENNPERVTIQAICEIGWPPKGSTAEQAQQAKTLLLAKDLLNAAAKPANGASIAFTLLVAGDDEEPKAQGRRWRWFRKPADDPDGGERGGLPWTKRIPPAPVEASNGGATVSTAGDSAGAAVDSSAAGTPASPPTETAGGGRNGGPSPPTGIGAGVPPSRMSLSRLAYPGLVSSARHFRWFVDGLLLLLFVLLILTCALSWDVSAGRAILTRLDAIETARATIQTKIFAVLVAEPKRSAPETGSTDSPIASACKPSVERFCDCARRLAAPKNEPGKLDQFENATQIELCGQLAENRINYSNAREDIADWLAVWGWLKAAAHKICKGRCLKDKRLALPADAVNQQQWAAVLVELFATAVLPFCYGFLGAGAAVVRNIWGKMRDSLLSPRDFTLALGQLALGAVIGACIGLFIAPGGTGSQAGGGLTGTFTLTPSALSFIAGFGVESVFVALEGFIGRVFNTSNTNSTRS
jgi:hypothetical protein